MHSQFSGHLQRLHLQQYIPLLQAHGYTSWSHVMAITEEDFDRMEFKLGHRRKLQREIANMEGYPQWEALPSSKMEMAQLSLPGRLKISTAFPPTKGNKQQRKRHSKSGAHVLKGAVTGVRGDSKPSQSTILSKPVLLFVEEGHQTKSVDYFEVISRNKYGYLGKGLLNNARKYRWVRWAFAGGRRRSNRNAHSVPFRPSVTFQRNHSEEAF